MRNFIGTENKPCVAIDLDGTLLHPEPEAIPVPGTSGFRYLSGKSAELLLQISRSLPVLIATGRNARSVAKLTGRLDQISFSGFVMENGHVTRTELLRTDKPDGNDDWGLVARRLLGWERLPGYENCLGLFFPCDEKNPEDVAADALKQTGKTGFIYREPRKIFIYPSAPDKLAGIHALGFDPFIVLGDESNDIGMLRASPHPATLAAACEVVKEHVRANNGYCSPLSSHSAAEDMLAYALEKIEQR